ncbi:MAG: hypothetical protein KIS92_02290 [Planctomycetota bacterium]|nr:hypothetical protein [Planctomycetota bacterium]
MKRTCGLGLAMIVVLAAAGVLRAEDAPKPLNGSQAVELAKKYLAEKDPEKKKALLAQAGETPADDPKPFLRLLQPAGYPPAKPGVQHGLKLDLPASVSDKPGEYSLSVPSRYAPNQLWPLVIGLHGGGSGSGSGKEFMQSMMSAVSLPAIIVCPTSVDLGNNFYWRNPKNEAMLDLLVKEMGRQFPVDHDKVYLMGYSMGGIGTYYLGPRGCDRYAAIAPGGGAWKGVYWAALLNTPVYIWHGKQDMRGKNFTDFPNAENAAACLKELGPDYKYEFRAMDCNHFMVPPAEDKAAVEWLLKQKRNPYPKRIVFASPRAKDFMVAVAPSPPDRWLTIDETGPAQLEMDGLDQGGTPRMKHKLKMGTLDASWTAPNTLEVKSQNVKKFRVFLSPNLVDFKKPLKIVVDGKPAYEGPAASSLKFLMQYLDERRDLSMAFVGEVVVEVK